MNAFRSPEQSLQGLDTKTTSTLIAAATDIALVVDGCGIIEDVALGSSDIPAGDYDRWLGQPLTSTVTIESRPKVDEMLGAAARNESPRWRHLNHTTATGSDLPILYSAVSVGEDGRVLAMGRDLRATAELQQRLVDVQQAIERDYSALRHLETRYRLLFQLSSEAVVIVDGASRKVLEANPAAARLLQIDVGETFPDELGGRGADAVKELLAQVEALGRTQETNIRTGDPERELNARASLFRQDGATFFLVRLCAERDSNKSPRTNSTAMDVIAKAPDAFVVTHFDGRIISVNDAFLEMVQLAASEQARGEALDRWLGRPGVDFNVLSANLREHGSVRLFATSLRGDFGAVETVEISAVCVPDSAPPCMGFLIRSVGRRPERTGSGTRTLPQSVDQMKDLVGRMPLKDVVRETTDLIERLCIEAALELTANNRASAAEMLGLSRQSLYVKLRRFGLLNPESNADG